MHHAKNSGKSPFSDTTKVLAQLCITYPYIFKRRVTHDCASILDSGVGRWFHLRGLLEPFPSPAKNGLSRAGRRCRAVCAYDPRRARSLYAPRVLLYHTSLPGILRERQSQELGLFHIALVACQDFLRGRQPPEPPAPGAPVVPTPLLDK